ncbi:SRPBCC family protein [Neorhizobium sp. NCHU2750]|uniref:SRPBCC family protein n=1 Tax=Neorhizobium sp. NCHU2750 TaxID=1825976 RepID=UPI000E74EB7D|nr:polyketide cyclase [Neorhizobium sp. NCHU2750]
MTTMPARIIHATIDRPWREVHAFASRPENMRLWAAGLAAGLTRDGEDWIGDGGPIGEIRVRFAPANDLGVIDHTVTLENGARFKNALRVAPNGDGAEVMFLLLRHPGVEDEAFETDAAAIARDLATLKALMEGHSGE